MGLTVLFCGFNGIHPLDKAKGCKGAKRSKVPPKNTLDQFVQLMDLDCVLGAILFGVFFFCFLLVVSTCDFSLRVGFSVFVGFANGMCLYLWWVLGCSVFVYFFVFLGGMLLFVVSCWICFLSGFVDSWGLCRMFDIQISKVENMRV